MRGTWCGAGAISLVVVALAACDGTRDEGAGGLPGAWATLAPGAFEPAPVPASARPLVDGLIANLTEGSSLVARVDAADAPCVARRWIGILDPAALEAAGVTAERMTTVRLSEVGDLLAAPLERTQAEALVDAFATCDVEYQSAVLASMRATGTVDAAQEACIDGALPEDLLEQVTLSVLIDPQLDAELTARYSAAVQPCLG